MNRVLKFALATAAVLLVGSPPAAAERATNTAPSTSLTFKDVQSLLEEGNPRMVVEREAIASARADRRSAGALPNPKLSINHQEPRGQQTLFTGERQEQLSIEVPILIPGQRSSRVAKADADIAAATARAQANTMGIRADAFASFIRMLATQHRSAILSNALAETSRLKETISGRAENGAASAYDLARVEVEVGVLAGHLHAALADTAAESSQLAGLLGLTNGLPIAVGTLKPWEIPARELFDPSTQVAHAPGAIVAAQEAAAAERGINAARKNRWPELSLEGGRAWTRHPFGAADFVGVSVELPLFDTRRGQLDKAQSDARTAAARSKIVIAETKATIQQLAETVQRRQAALAYFQTDLEPRLARLKSMSADAYLMGKHTILELIDANQARREVELEHIETLSSLIEAQIRFLVVTGRLSEYSP